MLLQTLLTEYQAACVRYEEAYAAKKKLSNQIDEAMSAQHGWSDGQPYVVGDLVIETGGAYGSVKVEDAAPSMDPKTKVDVIDASEAKPAK